MSGLVKHLKVINLGQNQLTDTGAFTLAEFVKNSQCLEGIQIHWNKIRCKGSIALAKVVKKCQTLLYLDVSFNAFSQGTTRRVRVKENDEDAQEIVPGRKHQLQKYECSEVAWKWRKAFMNNYSLMHVDISNNGFCSEDIQTIGDGLRQNHQILGFHTEGNHATMDALGFVNPIFHQDKESAQLDKEKNMFNIHNYKQIRVPQFDKEVPEVDL